MQFCTIFTGVVLLQFKGRDIFSEYSIFYFLGDAQIEFADWVLSVVQGEIYFLVSNNCILSG